MAPGSTNDIMYSVLNTSTQSTSYNFQIYPVSKIGETVYKMQTALYSQKDYQHLLKRYLQAIEAFNNLPKDTCPEIKKTWHKKINSYSTSLHAIANNLKIN